jgi:uncharacterized protein
MAEVIPLRPRKPCPICKKPSSQKYHPFCSNRCANEDLNSWLGGKYSIPVVQDEDEDGKDELS